jgi:hypothetical protein
MRLNSFFGIIITLILFSTLSTEANAQCKGFTKRNCAGELKNYNDNGQYNGAVMFEGEEATLMQTFYSNQEYRLFVCTQESIEEGMYFEVKDYRNNLIYSSQGKNSKVFDFNVESTQQLKVEVIVPGKGAGATQIKKNGCVSILVGFKEGY